MFEGTFSLDAAHMRSWKRLPPPGICKSNHTETVNLALTNPADIMTVSENIIPVFRIPSPVCVRVGGGGWMCVECGGGGDMRGKAKNRATNPIQAPNN